MNKKYSIGFLVCSLVILILIGVAYQTSFKAAVNQQQEEKTTTLEAKGNAKKAVGYYIMEKNGYLVVYYGDKKTVYEYTTIDSACLPSKLEKEVKNGKYVKNTEELYGILENYSS